MNLLWALIPDQALILVIAAIAIGLMLRIVSRRGAMALLGSIILMLLLEPLIQAIFDLLPWWLVLLILGFFVMSMVRSLFSTLLGTRATDHMVGILAADLVRSSLSAFFRFLTMPFRIAGWLLRRGY